MDAGQSIYEELKKKDISLIDQWVSEGYREDLHLDFKRKAKPENSQLDESDKRNLSRALSGFANSDGGVIIWGIDAPSSGTGLREKYPIMEVQNFAEHLDSMASRMVVPQVEGVMNHVIFENREEGTGYVVTCIPKSIAAPHRAEHHNCKRYYQRSGDSFIELEHWQLEYMFGRRQVPDLKVAWNIIPTNQLGQGEVFTQNLFNFPLDKKKKNDALIQVCVLNKGRAIAKYVCLRLHYRVQHQVYQFNKRYRHNLIDYSKPISTYFKPGYNEITARARPGLVVYPNDRMCFFEFFFSYDDEEVKNSTLSDFTFYYDLYAEHIRGITEQKMTIPSQVMCRILGE
ncbi:MAG: ATP-binding protein [Oligoflexales bacterium]|nr:ATP-binding protein [Oligoflexales bacterium]